jgi:hypothetical protein
VVLSHDRFARNRGAGADRLDLSVDPSRGLGSFDPQDRLEAPGSTLLHPGRYSFPVPGANPLGPQRNDNRRRRPRWTDLRDSGGEGRVHPYDIDDALRRDGSGLYWRRDRRSTHDGEWVPNGRCVTEFRLDGY